MTEQQNFPEVLLISCRTDIINFVAEETDGLFSLEVTRLFDVGKIQQASIIILDATILKKFTISFLQQVWILMRAKTVCINLLNDCFEEKIFGKVNLPFNLPFPCPSGLIRSQCLNFLAKSDIFFSSGNFEHRLSPEEELFFESFTGNSQLVSQLKKQIIQAAKNTGCILLTGETGTGKSIAAKIIHRLSREKNGPFVHANCANLRGELARSLLFGTDAGFMTDVQKTDGYLSKANNGILFLDETECLDLDIQSSLLLTLDNGSYYRIGNSPALKSSARMIFATNEDLNENLKSGKMRKDFYNRINDNVIHFPSLRERKEDIEPLARNFARRKKKQLSTEAVLFLEKQEWPGNVRALEKTVYRACEVCKSSVIEVRDIEV